MRLTFRAAALAAALAAPPAALAQHAANSGPGKQDAAAPAAQTAAVDRDGGRLRAPTREEIEVLTRSVGAMLAQDHGRVAETRLSDGTQLLGLDETWMNVSVAAVRGGEVEARCVESAAEARAFLAGTPPAEAASTQPAAQKATAAPGQAALEER